jgi:uncharacterized protein (TIGR02145 family)
MQEINIKYKNNKMKTINSFLTGLLLTASVFLTQQANAQAPQRMSYQSVLRNSSNVLLAETLVGIRISVLQGGAAGTAVYVETQTATTNANGLLSLQIGAGTASTGSFAAINWAAGTYFIKTETDPAGGTNYSITGTQEILSVPYAMYAAKSGDDSAQTAAITAMQAQISALQYQVQYSSIQIGTQQWMKKNLDVVTYRNGDIIPQVTDPTVWANLTTGAWCYYNNDPANGAIYGKLYNWYAVNDARGLAPQGWHIPTDEEWSTLSTFLGGISVAGGKMKTTGTTRWTTPNTGATNESGFSGLPGGYCFDGDFYGVGDYGYWWSSSEDDANRAWSRFLSYSNDNAYQYSGIKRSGFSVRCLGD